MEKLFIKDYGDYKLYLVGNYFEAWVNEEKRLESTTMANLTEKMDAALKRKDKIKDKRFPIDIYISEYGTAFIAKKVTSMDDNGDFWITHNVNGEVQRQKTRGNYLDVYIVNDKTTEVYNRVDKYQSQIAGLRELIKQAIVEVKTERKSLIDVIEGK